MRKNLLLTCLLTLIATFGMAQEISKFPITLTTADGLPGNFVVQNYMYKSKVYNLEEPVQTLRFTVCSTNTVESLGKNNHDGLSAYNGPGFPFFTMSEFRIYNGEGKQIEYVASSNSEDPNDGGGIAILNDGKENQHFHTNYGKRVVDQFPYEYHYVEFELAEPVSSFSFNWNTRSKYYKNLITYMGITAGDLYLPFPEQEFELGEKVTDVEELAEEGALFVLRGAADPYSYEYTFTSNKVSAEVTNYYEIPGNLYMHSPYGGSITPSATSVFYLIPDIELPNTYKLCWLHNGRYILSHELTRHTGDPLAEYASWTKNIMEAASIEFANDETVEGNFTLSLENQYRFFGYHGYGRMNLATKEGDEMPLIEDIPATYNWEIYKASINGAAITAQLQSEIDEADKRIAAIGGKVEDYDDGEYDALVEALNDAKAAVADPAVPASDIISMKTNLNKLTAAYAAVGIWSYVDSITTIEEAVQNEEITLISGTDWEAGAYSEEAFQAMVDISGSIQLVVERCESLADVDAAINEIYAAIASFWATEIPEDATIVELPFRVGRIEDGLPGINSNSVWVWESPKYYLTEEVDQLRFTVFNTKMRRTFSGSDKVFVCINEFELYDLNGKKINLTAENFSTNSCADGDGAGIAGLCDGGKDTDTGKHFHSLWGANSNYTYDGSEYFYLDIQLPKTISGFQFVQYARGNGWDDVPIDFAFGYGEETVTPEDVVFPDIYDPYETKIGEQITDASEITDDGLYALVGLINCAPEGNGEGYEKYYTSNVVYGTEVGAPIAFTITKTGDEDGTFYIRSLADSKYWSGVIDNDGWMSGNTTLNVAEAGKFHIVPNADARVEAEKEAFDNTFAIYMYNDTVQRLNKNYPEEIDSTQATPHPYIVVQDWGNNTGYFSIPSLKYNDFDGEGEWYIYKITMRNPYLYWLQSAYKTAAGYNFEVSAKDPGYYSEASVGPFVNALAKAQLAIDTEDNEVAKEALIALDATIASVATAEVNPMVPGVYVIETAYKNFGSEKKAICSYFNEFDKTTDALSDYNLWWTTISSDWKDAPIYFQFEFIPATDSEQVQIWLEDSVITAEQAENAYFIRSLDINQYVGTSIDGDRSHDIGFTVEPEEPYIVRSRGNYKFDIWHPSHANNSLHMEDNAGKPASDIVYWVGTSEPSQWHLHYIGDPTSIGGAIADDAEGDEVVSVSYYTVGGAAIAAPVQGINIEKTVYSNGVVKTRKIFVK